MRLAALLLLIAVAACAQTYETTPAAPRQGDAIRVRATGVAVSARMNGRTIRLFPQPDSGRLGLMPLPATMAPGAYKLEFLKQDGAVVYTAAVTISDAHFPVQNVVMSKTTAALKPAPGESETVHSFREVVTDERRWTEPLALPVPGCMISPFGVQRQLNGKATGDYHGGIDQRSPAGRPVHAVAAGTVRLVRQFQLHGGTVGIDHGQALDSMYLHLSKFAVTEGAVVEKGQVIGYVGSTGRSTGPHLHWSLYANQIPVNPAQWLSFNPCAASTKHAPTRVRKQPRQ